MAEKPGRLLAGNSKLRCLQRAPVILPVRFRLCDQEQQSGYWRGWTLDLSVDGMLIRCRAPVPDGGEHGREGRPVDVLIGSGTKLRVELRLGDDYWLNATGKVVWMEVSPSDISHLLRICFIDLDPEDQDTLQRFVLLSLL